MQTRPAHPPRQQGFNPLPPPKQGEMQTRPAHPPRQQGFNPLPPPKQGEISPAPAPAGQCTRFNPLPPPKQGEMHRATETGNLSLVSIRSPHRSRGRSGAPVRSHLQSSCFNPLPPPKQGEMRGYRRSAPVEFPFQSAPPTEAGGDEYLGRQFLHLGAVSIRSPHRSRGRFRTGA